MDCFDVVKEVYGCVCFLWNFWYDLCWFEYDDIDDELVLDEECMEVFEVEFDLLVVIDGDDWDYY